MIPSPEAVALLHQGAEALAKMEHNGFRIDTDWLALAEKKLTNRITLLEEELKEDRIFSLWRKSFGNNTNLNSRDQLASVLFNSLGHTCRHFTPTGKPSTKDQHLEEINCDFVKKLFHMKKLEKALNTYLKNIREETVDGFLHSVYHLHTVETYRSSASDINIQNIPIRDKEIGPWIRKCFIPRPGRVLAEIDFCLTGDTKIETIDGKIPIADLVRDISRGREVFVYGYDHEQKRVGVSKVLRGSLTRRKTEVWKVILDNGQIVKATPDHRFILRDGEERQLQDLFPGDSLMPFYKTVKKAPWGTNYDKIYLNNGQSMLAHNLIAMDVLGTRIEGSDLVVHHIDGKGTNNSLDNLEIMDRSRHMSIHAKQGWEGPKGGEVRKRKVVERNQSPESRERTRKMMEKRKVEWSEEDWKEWRRRLVDSARKRGANKGEKNPMFGRKHTEATKKKISKVHTGKKTGKSWNKGLTKETDESIRRAADTKIGKTTKAKGIKKKPLSEETKKKISVALKGRPVSETNKRKTGSRMKGYWAEKKFEECQICGMRMKFVTHSHLKCSHDMTTEEYKKTYNHEVVSIEFCGYEDVYCITVDKLHNLALSAGVIVKNCALEFRVLACFWKDPAMVRYASDKSLDIHRDMAMECFLLTKEEVTKETRFYAKNMLVFALFYGSYYGPCARNLWEAIGKMNLTTRGGTPLKDHLAAKGITGLGNTPFGEEPAEGTFEWHIRRVEKSFYSKFPVFAESREPWYESYRRKGELRLMTGFVCRGLYSRNFIMNVVAQGPGSHCKLWSLIQIQKWLEEQKKQTLLVAEIHDCIIADAVEEELQEFLTVAERIMTKDIRREWQWIICPMEAEVDVTPVNGSWDRKSSWVRKDGRWQPNSK